MSNYPKPSFCFYKESTAVMICKFCWRRAVCYPSTADEVDWNPVIGENGGSSPSTLKGEVKS